MPAVTTMNKFKSISIDMEELERLTRLIAKLGPLTSPSVEDVSGLNLKPRLVRLSFSVISLLSRLLPLEVLPSAGELASHLADPEIQHRMTLRNQYYEVISNLLAFACSACKDDPLKHQHDSFVPLFSPTLLSVAGEDQLPGMACLPRAVLTADRAIKDAVTTISDLKKKWNTLNNTGTQELRSVSLSFRC